MPWQFNMNFFTAEVHKAVILRYHVKPALEMIHIMPVQIRQNLFKDLHYPVLRLILIL